MSGIYGWLLETWKERKSTARLTIFFDLLALTGASRAGLFGRTFWACDCTRLDASLGAAIPAAQEVANGTWHSVNTNLFAYRADRHPVDNRRARLRRGHHSDDRGHTA